MKKSINKISVNQKVLIIPLGTTPHIIIEMLDKLLIENNDNIHHLSVIHTNYEKVLNGLKELKQFFEPWEIKETKGIKELKSVNYVSINKSFSLESVRLINLGISDIINVSDNDYFQQTLYDEFLYWYNSEEHIEIYVSIAGGRKSMSTYAFWAGQLFGASKIYHVIVDSAIESKPIAHFPLDKYYLIEIPFVNLHPLLKTYCRLNKIDLSKDISKSIKNISSIADDLIENSLSFIPSESYEVSNFGNFFYKDKRMAEIIKQIKVFAKFDVPILLVGETGVGKELLANAIHEYSDRRDKRIQKLNCAAIQDTLIEAELFGYEKGAFTGATAQKKGKIELADKGTLFLDEIGDLSLIAQAKLLRFLQEFEFERVGGTETLKADVRIISATNKNLQEEIRNKRFREDLYNRISGNVFHIPPLRERKSDIMVLAKIFLEQFKQKENKRKIDVNISSKAMEKLTEYHWPGNARQLYNFIRRIVIYANEERLKTITVNYVKRFLEAENQNNPYRLKDMEKQHIEKIYNQCEKNISETAKVLGITRQTLYSKLKEYKIT